MSSGIDWEKRRRLDAIRQPPPPPPLTPEQRQWSREWWEKMEQAKREYEERQEPEPVPPEQQRGITIDTPQARHGAYYHEFRKSLMQAAADEMDEQERLGRGTNTEGFIYAVADRAGIDMKTQDDVEELKPWVIKARERATEYRRRAQQNGGQFLIW